VTKPYVIPGTSVHLDVGMKIVIPIYGLHHDPKYFRAAEVFNPENFSDEIKATRPNYSYLPFGDGPRNCIGKAEMWFIGNDALDVGTKLDIHIPAHKWECASTVCYYKLFISKLYGTIFYHTPYRRKNVPT
jgi:hypothetical protein